MARDEISWTKAFFLASGCSLLCLAALVFLFWWTPSGQTDSNQRPWDSGGTLHRATGAQWRAATHENKLATAADWIAGFLAAAGASGMVRDRDKTRPGAERLVACMDEGVRGVHSMDNSKAYEFADGCWEIMLAQARRQVGVQ